MKLLRYWLFCWRFPRAKLTYEQWEFLDFTGKAYCMTIGKALEKLWRK